jgi:F0F1-type ATP synthase assembly protein I
MLPSFIYSARAAGRACGYTVIVARPKKTFTALAAEYTSLAFLLPASTFAGYAIGYLLDKAFGTHWLYIPFLILGSVAGFVQFIRQIMKDTDDNDS